MATPTVYMDAIRRWIMDPNRQPNKVVADAIQALLTTATTASTTASGSATDIATLQDEIATLQADMSTLQSERDEASLLVPIQYFDPAQILSVTDAALLTEDGDYFLTETGDQLLLEA